MIAALDVGRDLLDSEKAYLIEQLKLASGAAQ